MAEVKRSDDLQDIPLDSDEYRKKQCIVVQHSSAEEQGHVNLPAVKNKMTVAHLYLQKPSFKRNSPISGDGLVQRETKDTNNELNNSRKATTRLKEGKS